VAAHDTLVAVTSAPRHVHKADQAMVGLVTVTIVETSPKEDVVSVVVDNNTVVVATLLQHLLTE